VRINRTLKHQAKQVINGVKERQDSSKKRSDKEEVEDDGGDKRSATTTSSSEPDKEVDDGAESASTTVCTVENGCRLCCGLLCWISRRATAT